VTTTASVPATLRPGTRDDARACLDLLWASATDLGRRRGTTLEGSADDWWASSEPLYRFLAEHAAEWWVAEDPATDGRLIGYARSIERGGLLELTEFFVVPGEQSRGVGRALLERAFPVGRGDVRSIIATTDVRALARYYRADTVARFPYFTLAGQPSGDDPDSPLSSEPIEAAAASLTAVADVERAVLGYPRTEAEIRWLLQARDGWTYRDGGAVVGFAFVGKAGAGPIAAFEPRHLPDILLHVEARAAAYGLEKLELEVPAPNATAIRHLLGRGFRIDPWINLLMSNKPFGQFDRFVGYSPPIIL
jgi:GNAT superfamily N-acetyltransferase